VPRGPMGRSRSLLVCAAAYAAAAGAAVAVARLAPTRSPISAAALADLAATLVVFAFSLGIDNSSLYDPYWSVAPVAIALYWLVQLGPRPAARGVVVVLLLSVWAARLTANWLLRWRGLGDEDWRYAGYRRFGPLYWPISLFGFHLLPTVIVFLGCLSLVPTLSGATRGLGALDALAFALTLGAIALESVADRQLRRFLASPRKPSDILASGLWALSRHPNYFGEVAFWWGLYLFGLAANPSWWWTIAGPVAVTGLFLGVSVPMMDRHMTGRHPGYAQHMARRSAFLPWPRR
jgi:steroid 5-alpha reductase family enzyme